MRKTKLAGSLTLILMVLMVWGALSIMANPGSTGAVFVTKGTECGLRVEAGGDDVDVSRLNPGDIKESYLRVSNKGNGPLTYYMNIIRKGGKSGVFWNKDRTETAETGAMIEDVLQFTVLRGDEVLFGPGLLKDFKELKIGWLPTSEYDDIWVRVYFPEEADNDYQDSNMTVQFAFRAICDKTSGGGSDSPGGGSTGDRPDPPEGLEVDPPDEPGAPGEPLEPGEPSDPGKPDEGLVVPPADTPKGPGLPRTGQLPPWLWYGAGAALILAGVALRRRYRPGNR